MDSEIEATSLKSHETHLLGPMARSYRKANWVLWEKFFPMNQDCKRMKWDDFFHCQKYLPIAILQGQSPPLFLSSNFTFSEMHFPKVQRLLHLLSQPREGQDINQ